MEQITGFVDLKVTGASWIALLGWFVAQKIFETRDFDKSFSAKEIAVIDRRIAESLTRGKFVDAKEYFAQH